MLQNQQSALQKELFFKKAVSRKQMLPWWIKVFAWMFLIISAFVPIVLVMNILGYRALLSLYGLAVNNVFTFIGIALMFIFALKGCTAYGLLYEKDWAIKAGLVDGILGIVICMLVMIYSIINPFTSFSFRLELLALIPYLLRLLKIKQEWEHFVKP